MYASAMLKSREEIVRDVALREMSKGVHRLWDINRTPLRNYALQPLGWRSRKKAVKDRVDAEIFLRQKAAEAAAGGNRLRVLDIGVGTGTTWRKPLREYGESFDLCATTLCDCKGIWEGIRPMLKFTSASSVHLHYPAKSFQLILSHYGLHKELRVSFDGILSLLEKGGHAILSGLGHSEPFPSYEMDDFHAYLGILKGRIGSGFHTIKSHEATLDSGSSFNWFLWVEKK